MPDPINKRELKSETQSVAAEGQVEAPTERRVSSRISDHGGTSIAGNITSVLEAIFSLGKLALATLIFVLVWSNRVAVGQYLSDWLAYTSHISVFGFSVDRVASAQDTISEIIRERDLPGAVGEYASAAVIRASRNAPAIVGARILWVDQNPENNTREANVLMDMGIQVARAFNTKEALTLINSFEPDLIISNVVRDGDQRKPLKNCPAHYFELPPNVSGDLAQLNADTMAGSGKATGFYMAEAISEVASNYTDRFRPRIIYYSYSNGGIVSDQCSRVVTNRIDVLLQSVVSALEEIRWQKLRSSNPEEGASAARPATPRFVTTPTPEYMGR